MEVAVFVACMAIIAQINAAPALESGANIHHNNEFDLPPMARGGFEMSISASVYVNDSISNKLTVMLLPEALEADPNSVLPEHCKHNHNGKHICVVPNQTLMTRSGDPQTISVHRISVKAEIDEDDKSTLSLSVLLNGSHEGLMFIPLKDFDAQKHFSIGGIIDILKLEFEFKHQ